MYIRVNNSYKFSAIYTYVYLLINVLYLTNNKTIEWSIRFDDCTSKILNEAFEFERISDNYL